MLVHCESSSEELAPGTMVGDYRIEGTLGTGGMGTVYAATHPVIGKRAAIKVISAELSGNPEAVERFLFEARAVNEIGDPNIVDIFGFGSLPDGRVYLMMEWLVGETLAYRARFELLSIEETVHVIRTVARTLETVHLCGFIHRDLKPDNVFLARRRGPSSSGWPYEIVLLDFGIAKLVGDDSGSQLTRTGIIVGTPRYASPEQARGWPLGPACDVYSLGILAYELLLGETPFTAESAVETMAMHIHQQPVAPRAIRPEIPPLIDDLVLRMLAKNPAQRPSLAECRQRLGAGFDPDVTIAVQLPVAPAAPLVRTPYAPPIALPAAPPVGTAAVFTPPPERLSGRSGGRFWPVVALGAAVVLAAVTGGAALLRDRPALRAARVRQAATPGIELPVARTPRPAPAPAAAAPSGEPQPLEASHPVANRAEAPRKKQRRRRRAASFGETWKPAPLRDKRPQPALSPRDGLLRP